jgi:hypothetical protein
MMNTITDPPLCDPSMFHSAKGFLLLTYFLKPLLQVFLFELHPSLLELHALLDNPSRGY